jgi:hypothetical protein
MSEQADHEHGTTDNGVNDVKRTQTVDTVHNDEAMRVIANYSGDESWDEAEENKLRRKLDWKLMPVLCMTYGLQYYDKAMLSQAVSTKLFYPFQNFITPRNRTDTYKGHFRTAYRLGLDCRRSLLMDGIHVLPRLHRRIVPCHASCPTISHRTRRVRYRHSLGRLPSPDHGLRELSRNICAAILPRIPRKWH